MIIDNVTALSCMKKDMEYFYYDIIDLKYMSKSTSILSNTINDLINHNYIRITEYKNEILIAVYTNDTVLISDAILFAKKKGNFTIYISIENGMDISALTDTYQIEININPNHKHWGIYGAIKNADKINTNNDIIISIPSQSDIDFISSLPNKEWAFLPQRIKSLKNLLIAKQDDKLLGYLVYDSVESGHYDIVMVYTHPDYRRMGVASALIKAFAMECTNKNGISYYVCANSEGSAKLARSLNICEIRKETVIYKVI